MRQQIGIDFRKKLMCYPVPLLLLCHPPVDLYPTTLSRRTSLGTWERVEDTAINES
jgi:hypothetical protein